MTAEQLNAFIKSIQYVFESSIGTHASRKDLKIIKPGEQRAKVGGIPGRKWAIATVTLGGQSKGCLVMTVAEKTAIPLVAGMVHDRIGEMNALVRDGVGEMADTIAGSACGVMGGRVKKAAPATVVVDETVHVKLPSNLPSFELTFTTEYGDFNIDVALS